MTLAFIEGGAGTGKTTKLIDDLSKVLVDRPLGTSERVLALTKMHGGRRRVHARLAGLTGLRGRFECITVDSFAKRLAVRWRSLGRALTGTAVPSEFASVCDYAATLLAVPCVQRWVAASYPVAIIDEFQDSRDGQIRIVEGLSAQCICLVAGDAFQDLDGGEGCPAIDWARTRGNVTSLTDVHRTRNRSLLDAATALRAGTTVPVGTGFAITGVKAYGLGAWQVALHVARWRSRGTVAVISPVGPGKSLFVRQVIERVGEKPVGKKQKFGPYQIPWEAIQRDEVERLCSQIGLGDSPLGPIRADALNLDGPGRIRAFREWIRRQKRLGGRVEFDVAELREVAAQVIHQGRAQRTSTERSIAAMLVHQAKNREFDRVIVLWPYELKGSVERLRRLAYNAITRAKHEALVVVQDEKRASGPPFVQSDPTEAK